MRQTDIAERIHQQAGISEKEAAKLLDRILELLMTTLQKRESITILGFGKSTIRSKVPRTGRNFSTGESVRLPARRVVPFRPSPFLTTAMNSVQAEQKEAVTPTE
jgi:nucleoid DNA-binding protein